MKNSLGAFFKNTDFSLKIYLYQVQRVCHPLKPCKKSDKTSDPILWSTRFYHFTEFQYTEHIQGQQ